MKYIALVFTFCLLMSVSSGASSTIILPGVPGVLVGHGPFHTSWETKRGDSCKRTVNLNTPCPSGWIACNVDVEPPVHTTGMSFYCEATYYCADSCY